MPLHRLLELEFVIRRYRPDLDSVISRARREVPGKAVVIGASRARSPNENVLDIRAQKQPREVLGVGLEHSHSLESWKIGSFVVDLPYVALALRQYQLAYRCHCARARPLAPYLHAARDEAGPVRSEADRTHRSISSGCLDPRRMNITRIDSFETDAPIRGCRCSPTGPIA